VNVLLPAFFLTFKLTVNSQLAKMLHLFPLLSAEHQDFADLSHGENLKMKLYLNHSDVSIVYRRKSDNRDRVILDRGVLVTPLDPLLDGRLIVEGSQLVLKKLHVADTGVFKVTDLEGFPVVHSHIEVQGKKRHLYQGSGFSYHL